MFETIGKHWETLQWICIYDPKLTYTFWVKIEVWFWIHLNKSKIVLNSSCRNVFKAPTSHKDCVLLEKSLNLNRISRKPATTNYGEYFSAYIKVMVKQQLVNLVKCLQWTIFFYSSLVITYMQIISHSSFLQTVLCIWSFNPIQKFTACGLHFLLNVILGNYINTMQCFSVC